MTATFHEHQLIDSGNGIDFALQLTMPSPVTFAGTNSADGPLVKAGQNLPLYNGGGQPSPGTYWLIVDPHGNASVLAVSERPVGQVGIYGYFRKQNGVLFVCPRSEQDSSWAFVYEQAK
jgi:hypothetical protein